MKYKNQITNKRLSIHFTTTMYYNTQLQGIHTCNNDNDATSFPWRVDSVGIPDKIDV